MRSFANIATDINALMYTYMNTREPLTSKHNYLKKLRIDEISLYVWGVRYFYSGNLFDMPFPGIQCVFVFICIYLGTISLVVVYIQVMKMS